MSEITHLICAHCGADVALSNHNYPFREQPTVLTLYVPTSSLVFNCPKCGTQYSLPVLPLEPINEPVRPATGTTSPNAATGGLS